MQQWFFQEKLLLFFMENFMQSSILFMERKAGVFSDKVIFYRNP